MRAGWMDERLALSCLVGQKGQVVRIADIQLLWLWTRAVWAAGVIESPGRGAVPGGNGGRSG